MRRLSITAAFAVGLAVIMTACSVVSSFDGLACGADCDGTDGALDVSKGASDGGALDQDGSVNPQADAAADTGTHPGADTGTPLTDSGPQGLQYTCTATGKKGPDCSKCLGATVPCVLCANAGNDHSNFIGVCVTNATSSACEGKGPATYDDCNCTNSPAICSAPFNICVQQSGPACRTCGWDGGVGLPCKGGGICNLQDQCQ